MGRMSDAAAPDIAKLKKRQRRNLRKARADGVLQGVCAMLTAADTVVDCGANVGDVTAQLADTGATVHAFEPDPFAFGELEARFAGVPNVTLHNVAVGTTASTVRLMRAENFGDNPKGGSVKSTVLEGGHKIAEGAGIDVAMIDFPAFLAGLGQVAFLKMDIEGAELDILEEMERRSLFAPIRLTLVETHERKFKALRPRFKALKDRIGAAYPKTKVNLDWI